MKRNRTYVLCTGLFLVFLALISNGTCRTLLLVSGGLAAGFSLIYFLGLPGKLICRLVLTTYTKKKENIVGELQVVHGGLFPIFYGKAFFQIENFLTGEREDFDLSITLMRKEEGSSSFDFRPAHTGIIEVTLDKVELYGLLGCMKKTIPIRESREIMIMPDTFDLELSLHPVLRMNEEGEKTVRAQRGFDPGLYDGIRPFRDGDSIKSIHWKLTGKTEEYVVRELGMPAVMLPVLYLETVMEDKNPAMIDALMEIFISISQKMAEEGFLHCLCWYDGSRGQWIWHRVSEIAHLDESFGVLLRTSFQRGKTPHFFEIGPEEWEQYGQIIVVSDKEADYTSFLDRPEMLTLLLGKAAAKETGKKADVSQKTGERAAGQSYVFGPDTYAKDLCRLEL